MAKWTEAELAEYEAKRVKGNRAIAVTAKKRIQRHEVGKKNSLEQRFENEILQPSKMAGDTLVYHFEQIKLRLANNTYYTPDFFEIRADGGLIFHEIKGFWQDDARVKIKVAAEQYPIFEFIAWTWAKKDGWKSEVIESGMRKD